MKKVLPEKKDEKSGKKSENEPGLFQDTIENLYSEKKEDKSASKNEKEKDFPRF